MSGVQRVVIVGPGAAGKTVLAARLGVLTGLPVIELDKVFWLDSAGSLYEVPPNHSIK